MLASAKLVQFLKAIRNILPFAGLNGCEEGLNLRSHLDLSTFGHFFCNGTAALSERNDFA
jgi:hypothetical protein